MNMQIGRDLRVKGVIEAIEKEGRKKERASAEWFGIWMF